MSVPKHIFRILCCLSYNESMYLQESSHSPVWQLPDVTRVEVVDGTGRSYVNIGVKDVEAHVQDGGRTLKVFLTDMDAEGKNKVREDMSDWAGFPDTDMSSEE